MEAPWNFATTAALIVFVGLVTLVKKWQKSKSVPVNLPPGPRKLPIIGNLHLISQPPFRCLRDLARQHGPIMHLKLGEVDTIVVSSPEIAKEILKDNDPVFSNRPESIALKVLMYNYSDIVFSPYGDYWRQMRKICTTEMLSTKNVRSSASVRKDEASRLVESVRLISAGIHPVNLTERVSALMSSVICRAAYGKVCKDKDSLIELVAQALEMSTGFSIADIFPSSMIAGALSLGTRLRLKRMRRKIDLILDDVIHDHENKHNRGSSDSNSNSNEDLVDVLLRIKENGELKFPITNDNIKAILLDMFAGGTETTSSTIDWAMSELMRNSRVMAKVQAEIRRVMKGRRHSSMEDEDIEKMSYLKLVIMETHRLHPQASVLARASREECEVSGYTIPEKVKILVNVWAIQRDPNYWEDSETFKPERFQNPSSQLDFKGTDFRYLPFGSGKRLCPGITLGSANVALFLAQLLYNFDWKLPHGVRALDMTETTGIATSRKQNLILIATSPILSSAS